MTPTNRLPAIEALGEVLAALDGKREAFRRVCDKSASGLNGDEFQMWLDYQGNAVDVIARLANSGWTLTPGPTVNAGEEG